MAPPDKEPFQLPLSGSRAADPDIETGLLPQLSTPSLGITSLKVKIEIEVEEPTFNSLSRDHLAKLENTALYLAVGYFSFNSLSRDHSLS